MEKPERTASTAPFALQTGVRIFVVMDCENALPPKKKKEMNSKALKIPLRICKNLFARFKLFVFMVYRFYETNLG